MSDWLSAATHLGQNANVMHAATRPPVGPDGPAPAACAPGASTRQVRIGVSIPVPEPYFTRLARARVEAGDPLARSVPPHITLVPPTDVRAGDLARVEHHLQAVAAGHAPFVVDLAGTATFRPISPVVFVRLSS